MRTINTEKALSQFEINRSEFLKTLKGKTDNPNFKYKRCSASTLRYPGGKSLAVGLIVENLPSDIDKLVSPFFGGGSVEIACARHLGLDVIGYDIFDILANYWNIQLTNKVELFNRLEKIEPTKENFNSVKAELTRHFKGEIVLDSITLATYYFFNFSLSYGPSFLGWMSSIYTDKNKYKNIIAKVKDFDTKGSISVHCATFEQSIPEHSDDFLYLDPPYYLGGTSKMFKGIYPQRNFPIHHNGFDHKKLCDILRSHKGGFLMSYNDCKEIREMYSDCQIIDVQWQYTMGQGEKRIGKNRKESKSNIKDSHEILIKKLF